MAADFIQLQKSIHLITVVNLLDCRSRLHDWVEKIDLITTRTNLGYLITQSIDSEKPIRSVCRGGLYTPLADRSNNMERNDSNESICEELIGEELGVRVV